MKNFDKYLLFSYISYISIFILIFITGITGVFASSYSGFDFTAQLYDNVNGNLTSVTTGGPAAATGLYEGYIAYTANSSGGAWGISSPITLLSNHTYTLTASIPNECGNLVLSTHNRIGVGTTLANAKSSYQNNSNVDEVYSKVIGGDNFLIQFAFTPKINGSFIVFPFATSKSCTSSITILESISIEDLGVDGVTQDEINSSLNQQTTTITENITNMGEDIKDSIKDNFNDCKVSPNLFNPNTDIEYDGQFRAWINGSLSVAPDYLSIKVKVKPNTTYVTSSNLPYSMWSNLAYFDSYMNYLGGLEYSGSDKVFTTPSNCSYVTIALLKNYNWFKLQEGDIPDKEICQNKIDETNNQLGDLNNSLNNSNSSGATNDASNFFSNFTTDTFGLTSIITAPLSIINNLTSSSCSTLRLPLPYLDNKYLELPCMETIYNKYFGSFFTIYQTITFGIVAYWVIVRIFNQVKDFKNPDHDEIEVLDL